MVAEKVRKIKVQNTPKGTLNYGKYGVNPW